MPSKLTDAEAVDLYLRVGWEDPCNAPYPDPEIAEEVRAMIDAPTLADACRVINWWFIEGACDDLARAWVATLRKYAGKDDSVDLTSRLKMSENLLCDEAAYRIQELEVSLNMVLEIAQSAIEHKTNMYETIIDAVKMHL